MTISKIGGRAGRFKDLDAKLDVAIISDVDVPPQDDIEVPSQDDIEVPSQVDTKVLIVADIVVPVIADKEVATQTDTNQCLHIFGGFHGGPNDPTLLTG
ncbi:unnamed protein product [Vicia faba]|uniref:Uncharacterized protein n=1 Tax=Vicia faba TaxID=3906 RepID=A0AAV1AB06_VICFA|nr:unnamed protein product [Vicia faba]